MNDMSGFGVDLSTVEAKTEYVPLPEGDYVVMCTDCEIDSKDDGRRGLKVKFQVVEGDFEGRPVHDYFVLVHPNAQAQGIGQQRMRGWCDALGANPATFGPNDVLHQKVIASFSIQQPKPGSTYGPSNRVKGFKPLTNAAQPAQPTPHPVQPVATQAVATQPAATQPVQGEVSKKMPWD